MTNPTDTRALQALADKVEAGEASTMAFEDAGFDGWAELAYHGSLDAARALHEAVLPGYRWGRQWSEHMWVEVADIPGRSDRYYGKNADPARAWLLAIIRTLIAGGRE